MFLTKVINKFLTVKMGDSASIDAFARLRVSNPTTLFDSKQIFDNAPLFWDDQEVSGSGTTSVHSVFTASSVMGVSANTIGKRVRQTYMRFNYSPGKSQLIFLTGTLGNGGGGSGINRCMGIYTDDNGIFMQEKDGLINAVLRSSATGTPVDNVIPQSEWNIDKLDGKGPSKILIDGTKSQILFIDYEWLAVGRVRIGFVFNGIPAYVHEFNHANFLAGAYMSTPNLPLRYEISNDGTGQASTLEHICGTVISEGGTNDLGNICYDSTGGTHLDANVQNELYAVMGLRLKTTHIGQSVKLLDINLAEHTGNKDYEWIIAINPIIAGTFTYTDLSGSSLQTAKGVTANTVTNGSRVGGGYASSASKGSSIASAIDNARLLGSAIDGTRDTLVLCVRPVGGSTNIDIEGSITWRELS